MSDGAHGLVQRQDAVTAASSKTAESSPLTIALLHGGKLCRDNYLAMCRVMVQSHISLAQALKLHKELYVTAALEVAHGNRVQASAMIETHRNTLSRIAGKKR